MMYLSDPWMWLATAVGFLVMSGCGVLGRKALNYSSALRGRNAWMWTARAEGAKILVACFIIASAALCIRFFQRHFGGPQNAYVTAFIVGQALGLPIAWFFEFTHD